MKRTELERHQRDLNKIAKREKAANKNSDSSVKSRSVNDYINGLFSLFLYDGEEIFNTNTDEKIMDLLEEMKSELPEKQWDNVLRKGIKKTNINQKEKAFDELKFFIA